MIEKDEGFSKRYQLKENLSLDILDPWLPACTGYHYRYGQATKDDDDIAYYSPVEGQINFD